MKLSKDKDCYDSFWYNIKKDFAKEASSAKKKFHIYIHSFGSYFDNQY